MGWEGVWGEGVGGGVRGRGCRNVITAGECIKCISSCHLRKSISNSFLRPTGQGQSRILCKGLELNHLAFKFLT